MVTVKCNCGREGRYMMLGSEVMSCNKYALCKPYDQLEGELEQLKKEFDKLLEAANDLRVFREGTGYYNDAEDIVLKFKEDS